VSVGSVREKMKLQYALPAAQMVLVVLLLNWNNSLYEFAPRQVRHAGAVACGRPFNVAERASGPTAKHLVLLLLLSLEQSCRDWCGGSFLVLGCCEHFFLPARREHAHLFVEAGAIRFKCRADPSWPRHRITQCGPRPRSFAVWDFKLLQRQSLVWVSAINDSRLYLPRLVSASDRLLWPRSHSMYA
jgi:hypothetical protein